MTVPRDRDAVVGHRVVALHDQVRLDFRMLRTRHFVAFARHETAVETHLRRTGDDFAAMVGVVTDTDEVHHEWDALLCW